MEKFFSYIIKVRWAIIFLVLAVTVFLGLQIPDVRINSDVISSLPESDKDAALIRKIGTQFGGNKTGMIIIETENIFTAEVLGHIRQITDTLTETENISSVISLTNAVDIRAEEDGIEIRKLVDEDLIPESQEELALLKAACSGK